MSEEVRTRSASGAEKGVKPQAHSLLPKAGLDAIAEVFNFGRQKYAAHNWRAGYEWSKSFDAAQRHLLAFWDGETDDPESGLPHLAHAGFHILAMLTWLDEQGEGGEYDDRYRRPGPGPGEVLDDAGQPGQDRVDAVIEMQDRLKQMLCKCTLLETQRGPFGPDLLPKRPPLRDNRVSPSQALNDYYNREGRRP